jgi:hypothetical protein
MGLTHLAAISRPFVEEILPILTSICRDDNEEAFQARRQDSIDDDEDMNAGPLRRSSRRVRMLKSSYVSSVIFLHVVDCFQFILKCPKNLRFMRHFEDVLTPDEANIIGKMWSIDQVRVSTTAQDFPMFLTVFLRRLVGKKTVTFQIRIVWHRRTRCQSLL